MRMTAGTIRPTYDLCGETLTGVRPDDPALWAPSSPSSLEDLPLAGLIIGGVRIYKEYLFVSFEGTTNHRKTEELRDARLLAEEHEGEDARYPHQLKGPKALTPKGGELDTVLGVRFRSAQDLLLVRISEGTVMVPFTVQIVPEADLKNGVIMIDTPPDLFDDGVVDTGEMRSQR